MEGCLLVVDLQNDYFSGGKMELSGIGEATQNASRLLTTFREAALPIIHVRHLSTRPDANFFLPDTHGAEIYAAVAPLTDETVIEKNFPNAFLKTDLQKRLNQLGPQPLNICGAMSHMCIDATTRAAADLGFQCTVAEDACATRDLIFKDTSIPAAQVHAAFMAALSSGYARMVTTDEIIEAI